ncbi:MAG: hypothetical protein EKK42_20275 [Pseudonocardiaceae bacterium]|nr:MAG: hypothetical protein EKK42_20275 [Pseudonocardiaceae bacterium]
MQTPVITDESVTFNPSVSEDDLTKPAPTETADAQRLKHTRSTWGVSIALALKFLPHVYAGTVSDETKRKRRNANRVARASRRINRVRGAK